MPARERARNENEGGFDISIGSSVDGNALCRAEKSRERTEIMRGQQRKRCDFGWRATGERTTKSAQQNTRKGQMGVLRRCLVERK